MLKDYLNVKGMSVYKLAKDSDVPYTTVLELTKSKTNVYNATVGTVNALAKTLDLRIDDFIVICAEKRVSFQEFRSLTCHKLKSEGDKKFMKNLLLQDEITRYYDYGWYEESLYLLAMLDYLKNEYDIKNKDSYDELRKCKLEEPVYPRDVLLEDELTKDSSIKKEVEKSAIKEFLKYNIIETDIRNVI